MPLASAAQVRAAQRVVLLGVTGSGKTTAATRLAAARGLVLLRTDDVRWAPGWEVRPVEEQRQRAAPVVAGERWVLDALPAAYADLVLARADLLVALDLGRLRTFARLLRRTARRVVLREPCCGDNVETLARALSRDSILRWHATSYAAKRRELRARAAAPDGVPVALVRRPRDLEVLLARSAQHPAG